MNNELNDNLSLIYKKCFKNLTLYLSYFSTKTYSNKKIFKNLNVYDVEYSDGYFIFERGENSVVTFRIKEFKGWLFGCWFCEPEKDKNFIEARIFWQYEKFIDKFKPSASPFETTICFCKDGYFISNFKLDNLLLFMIEEPELSFCKDVLFWDYEYEYHSRRSAKREMKKVLRDDIIRDKKKNKFKKKVFKLITKHLSKKLGYSVHILSLNDDRWAPNNVLYVNKTNNFKLKFSLENMFKLKIENEEGKDVSSNYNIEEIALSDIDVEAYDYIVNKINKYERRYNCYDTLFHLDVVFVEGV